MKQQQEGCDDGGGDPGGREKGIHPAIAELAPAPLPPPLQQQQLEDLTYAEVGHEQLAVGKEGEGGWGRGKGGLKMDWGIWTETRRGTCC